MVEQGTFNAVAEGSIPSALTIIHNPSPSAHSFPGCSLSAEASAWHLPFPRDLQVLSISSLYQTRQVLAQLRCAKISFVVWDMREAHVPHHKRNKVSVAGASKRAG